MTRYHFLSFALLAAAAAPGAAQLTFTAIPDQDQSTLQARATAVTNYVQNYISTTCGGDVTVTYNPVTNYQDAVDALLAGTADFGWYGGLTGVQAGLRSAPSVYLTQRVEDTEFTSVFIQGAGMDLPQDSLEGVQGKSMAFGSQSSTSGNLMPQYYLDQAGVTPASSIYTGSHDATVDAVMNGTTEAGALNSVVWYNRVAAGTIGETSVFYTTPEFVDYLWVAGAGINDTWAGIEGVSSAEGCTDINALLIDAFLAATNTTALGLALFEAYSTVGYVPITPGEYDPIEETGCQLDLIEEQYCAVPPPENLGNVGTSTSTSTSSPPASPTDENSEGATDDTGDETSGAKKISVTTVITKFVFASAFLYTWM